MPSPRSAPASSWVEAALPPSWTALEAAGVTPELARILARRGVASEAEAEAFLAPRADQLHDPCLIPGLVAAVERLTAAGREKQRVAIVGDYDVDGISATALLAAVFTVCGMEVMTVLPQRLQEGYGFQPLHVAAAHQRGAQLVVTADCGSTARSALAAAKEHRLEVIVTDHHLSDQELPDWVIEVNPSRRGGAYPFPHLSGVGVAYKLAVALARRLGKKIEHAALLRVACLGTICDLVPLVGENRVIAALGLEALATTRSLGLQALMQRAGVQAPLSAADIGFRLGPRLNAAGRLASPEAALELMMTRDRVRAGKLAEELDSLNRQRQVAEQRVVDESLAACGLLEPLPPILVAWSDRWHRGVVGIAAGRLARRLQRPTVLLSVEGARATGSGRSVEGIHLYRFLARWHDRFERFGGHAQAIGLTLRVDELEPLRQAWEREAAASWDPELLSPRIAYELELPPAAIDDRLLAELQRLEPHGVGNRRPILRVGPLRSTGEPRRFGRGHLAVRASGPDGHPVELLGWGWQERESHLRRQIEVVASLQADRLHGGPVLRLLDARPWSPRRSTPTSTG